MIQSIAQRAQFGAVLLDTKVPGWAKRINFKQLNMADGRKCFLAQLFGSYTQGRVVLNLTQKEAADHGFQAYDRRKKFVAEFSRLRTAMRRQVNRRLAA